jgi:saccharopine dehydrogenase-like NADP-dependent oxidoreductase
VIGEKNGRKVEYVLDCISGVHSRWGVHCATQVPPSIAAQMQAKGMIKEPGVWAPEQVIDPEYFFRELSKREMRVQVMVKEDIV